MTDLEQRVKHLEAVVNQIIGSSNFSFKKDLRLEDGNNVVMSAVNGSKIGTNILQKLAFYNSTPISQRTNASQAAVVTTGSTQTNPYGYTTAAQADAIVTLVNELRAAMVALGLIKGS